VGAGGEADSGPSANIGDVSEARSARGGPAPRFALLAAVAVLGLGGTALAGCGDDEETAATTPTTTDTEATGPTGPSDQSGGGGGGAVGGEDQTPADTGPTVPESGGVGADDHDAEQGTPEEDTEENDVPPPPGSPAEQFEQECEAHPEIC
jgi:hypothetical protein